MHTRYRTQAINTEGGDGVSRVPGGLEVAVTSPLGDSADAGSNPEQLLALAWATCLNATAQVIVRRRRRTAVRVEVALCDAEPGPGYEFHVDAYLSVEGVDEAEAARVLEAAHSRCPVSKLLSGASTVRVHTEDYSA